MHFKLFKNIQKILNSIFFFEIFLLNLKIFYIDLKIAEQHKIWLIHNQNPKDEVIKKWDESYELRLHDCANKLFKNINDIIKKWPILTSNFGYVLVIVLKFKIIIIKAHKF